MGLRLETANLLCLFLLHSFWTRAFFTWAQSSYLSKCNSTALDWYVNAVGETPCMTYQRLRQVCDGQYELSQFDTSLPGDICNSQLSACCCNHISFTLSMLCYNCQYDSNPNGFGTDAPNGTYFTYANGCTPLLNTTINSAVQTAVCNEQIDLRPWLYTSGWVNTGTWFYVYFSEQAELEINQGEGKNFSNCPSFTSSTAASLSPGAKTATAAASSVSSAIISTSSPDTSARNQNSVNIGALAGGLAGGVIALLLIAGAMLFLCWKRLKRKLIANVQGEMSQDAPLTDPFVSQRGETSSSYLRGHEVPFPNTMYGGYTPSSSNSSPSAINSSAGIAAPASRAHPAVTAILAPLVPNRRRDSTEPHDSSSTDPPVPLDNRSARSAMSGRGTLPPAYYSGPPSLLQGHSSRYPSRARIGANVG